MKTKNNSNVNKFKLKTFYLFPTMPKTQTEMK